MPMRVESASASMRITRVSSARETTLPIITNSVTTTRPFSSAQIVKRALPGMRSMESSVSSTKPNQPSTEKLISSHSTSVSRVSQRRTQLSRPISSAVKYTARRTTSSTVPRRSAVSTSATPERGSSARVTSSSTSAANTAESVTAPSTTPGCQPLCAA